MQAAALRTSGNLWPVQPPARAFPSPEVRIRPLRQTVLPAVLLVCAAVVAARLAAARPPAAARGVAWQLDGVRAAYCVRFLVRPNILPYVTPEGIAPIQAGRVPELDPILRQAVAERPDSFGTFTPSRLCTVHFRSARIGEKVVSAEAPGVLSLVVWSIAAVPEGADGRVPVEAAIEVRANEGDLVDAIRDDGVRAGKIWTRLGELSDSAREESSLRLGETSVVWEGRLAMADSTASAAPVSWTWWAEGSRDGPGSVRIELRPTDARAMVGSLRVTGEDDFSESLIASPVRFAGPIYLGGTGTVTVTR